MSRDLLLKIWMNLKRMLNGERKRLATEASLGEVKQADHAKLTRDANDLTVHAKRLNRERPLLAGLSALYSVRRLRLLVVCRSSLRK